MHVQWIAGEQDVEAAKQIIDEKFAVVGLVEEFDQSFQMLAKSFELKHFSCRVSKPQMLIRDISIREEIEQNYDRYHDAIVSNNLLDIQLFEHAKNGIWQDQKGSLTDDPENASRESTVFQKVACRFRLANFKFMDKMIYAPFVRFFGQNQEK